MRQNKIEITSHIVDTPPRDAATVLILREGQSGLEVLLLKRHSASKDLGGAFVFPGGKRDEADASPARSTGRTRAHARACRQLICHSPQRGARGMRTPNEQRPPQAMVALGHATHAFHDVQAF